MESQNHVSEDKKNAKEKYGKPELIKYGTIKDKTDTTTELGGGDADSWKS